MWVALLALVVAALGGTAMHSVKKKQTVDSSE